MGVTIDPQWLMAVRWWLGGDGLSRSQFWPFSGFLFKTFTANYIPFHLDAIFCGADINVDAGFNGVKGGIVANMAFLMLCFYGVVGDTAIDIVTVNTNTHIQNPLYIFKRIDYLISLSANLAYINRFLLMVLLVSPTVILV